MYRLFRADGTDLTNRVLNITWKSSSDTLGDELDFSLLQPDKNYNYISINNGDIVLLYNDQDREIFRGIIETIGISDRNTMSYNAFDFAFYLNKNKKIYQFDTTVSNALATICNDFEIPIGEIIDIPTIVQKIYTGNISDTIKDLIELGENEQGKKYYFEMSEGKFYVKEKGTYLIKATTNAFGTDKDLTNFISEPSRKLSIGNMRNSIQITSGNEENINVLAVSQNDEYMAKYGLLQEIQSIDENTDIAKAQSIANNLLNELCKESEEVSLTLIGSDKVRANVSMEVTEEITGASGIYLVKDVTHNIEKGIHKMSLSLEK
jgi:hypothetical protein